MKRIDPPSNDDLYGEIQILQGRLIAGRVILSTVLAVLVRSDESALKTISECIGNEIDLLKKRESSEHPVVKGMALYLDEFRESLDVKCHTPVEAGAGKVVVGGVSLTPDPEDMSDFLGALSDLIKKSH